MENGGGRDRKIEGLGRRERGYRYKEREEENVKLFINR